MQTTEHENKGSSINRTRYSKHKEVERLEPLNPIDVEMLLQ